MATINLGNLTFVTLRSDLQTPAQFTQFEGLRLSIPEAVTLPALGEYSTMTASGVTVFGFTRTGAGGDLEWLMTPQVDPALAKVNDIPGVGGWSDPTAKAGYLSQGKALQGLGVSAATLWPGLTNFYNWARADLMAKGWTGP